MRYLTNEVGAARRRDGRLLIAVLGAVLALAVLFGGRAQRKHRQTTGAELARQFDGFATTTAVPQTD